MNLQLCSCLRQRFMDHRLPWMHLLHLRICFLSSLSCQALMTQYAGLALVVLKFVQADNEMEMSLLRGTFLPLNPAYVGISLPLLLLLFLLFILSLVFCVNPSPPLFLAYLLFSLGGKVIKTGNSKVAGIENTR